MIVKLTPEFIANNLVCPEGKRRIEYVDTGGTGLYLEVRSLSQGQGTYYLRYRDTSNSTRHTKLGTTTNCDLKSVRESVKVLRAKMVLNDYPHDNNKTHKDTSSFHTFFTQPYMSHSRVHSRGFKKKLQMYNLRLKEAFGIKQIDQIKHHEVSSWHIALREDGLSPAYADRFLALLRHALNMAVEWDMLEKNPAARVKLFNPDNSVQQHLNQDELKRLMKVLRTDKNRTVCLIALFLLSTGVRLNEALQAKWVDIDKDNKIWRIPAANAKSKRSRLVPLNSFAINDVLDQLDTKGKYEHLFVNGKTGKGYSSINKTWNRLRTESNLPGFKLHSLRRSYASFVVNSGHSLYQASKLLGHSDPSITAKHYAVMSNSSQQSAAESVGNILSAAMPESP